MKPRSNPLVPEIRGPDAAQARPGSYQPARARRTVNNGYELSPRNQSAGGQGVTSLDTAPDLGLGRGTTTSVNGLTEGVGYTGLRTVSSDLATTWRAGPQ
jgi:hypothetical protein